MKRVLLFWILSLCLTTGGQASETSAQNEMSMTVVPDDALCDNFLGFGAHGDYLLTCGVNTKRGVTQQDEKIVLDRIRDMCPHVMRTFWSYTWWEDEEGKQTPGNEFIKDYVKWAKFLKDIDCKVNLTPWGDYFAYSNWMDSKGSRLPSVEKEDAMIRSLVDFVEYLRRDQNLTNVSYLTMMNEPYHGEGHTADVQRYVNLHKKLNDELIKRDLRKDIFLIGVDDCAWDAGVPGSWFHNVVSAGGIRYCDGTAGHTYGQQLDLTSKHLSLQEWIGTRMATLKKYDKSDKLMPLMITEFSTWGGTFDNPNNHLYEHGLFLPNFAITSLNQGVAQLCMWCLFDTYYDAVYKQGYGLWRWKDENWEPRPGFYSWSLLTRFTKPGSKVMKVNIEPADTDKVKAVAFLSPDNQLTIAVLNVSDEQKKIRLQTGLSRDAALDYYEYSRQTIPTKDSKVLSSSRKFNTEAAKAKELIVPDNSFVVLTEIRHDTAALVKRILENVETPAAIIADADTAELLSEQVKDQDDIMIMSNYRGFENPRPFPTRFDILHIMQFWKFYVVSPDEGYPKELLAGCELVPAGPLYRVKIKTE